MIEIFKFEIAPVATPALARPRAFSRVAKRAARPAAPGRPCPGAARAFWLARRVMLVMGGLALWTRPITRSWLETSSGEQHRVSHQSSITQILRFAEAISNQSPLN